MCRISAGCLQQAATIRAHRDGICSFSASDGPWVAHMAPMAHMAHTALFALFALPFRCPSGQSWITEDNTRSLPFSDSLPAGPDRASCTHLSMALTPDDVSRIAHLARLELQPAEQA